MSGLLDTASAAMYLGFSPTTLRIWRSQGRKGGAACPAFVRTGRMIRYRVSDLDAFIEAQVNPRGFGR